MRTCPACQKEFDATTAAGICPHCGAVIHKIAQRTIEDKFLLREESESPDDADTTYEFGTEDSIVARPSDTMQGETVDLSAVHAAELLDVGGGEGIGESTDDTTELKSPTIAGESDMTMEFGAMPAATPKEEPKKKTRRSTHTLERDRTVDLGMSPAEARHLDSQWRGTFDLGTKQGQTVRGHETVTGFRSSLPVKSRYVREKRKSADIPPKSLAEVPDYELLDIIGEGGMGVVYAAHQSSIARTVAVKMLKPTAKVREDQRDKFISEAVVTGELDHPNIVPIYDLGSNDEGALFYSMKRVKGTPWDKVIDQKTLDENLSILLRVADAVAFAHAGGVIHRDLKPENVMLGDYGEVLVMDWGLARITSEFAHVNSVYQADSLGGTPAYMAPEMAKGPIENISKTSDVYLLGAILYEIIGGQPPHSGRDVMQCLMAASQNKIDSIRYDGELKIIALKAMATRQDDRYQTVKELQEAIRVYQSHSESLVLAAHANQNLQKARALADGKDKSAKEAYPLFARSLYGFQESLALWDENQRARNLLKETQFDYASCALDNGDLDLAASLLDTKHDEHQALMTKIDAARKERNARERRLRLAKFAVAALVAGIILSVTAGLLLVNAQRKVAVAAKEDAVNQRGIAVTERDKAKIAEDVATKERDKAKVAEGVATTERDKAKIAEGVATTERDKAKIAEGVATTERDKATEAKKKEEYEAYVAQIGLASAKIDENAYDFALTLLNQTQPERRNWEWGRLYHLCTLGSGEYDAAGPIDAVAYSPDGKTFAMGDRSGELSVYDVGTPKARFQVPHNNAWVLSVDYSRDGKRIATGASDNNIRIIDAANGKVLDTLPGHADAVLTVRFSPDGRQLLSGSCDKTARLWDLASRQPLQVFKGHSWWVWAAEFSRDASRIVTAGQDGKAVVWQIAAVGAAPQPPAPGPQPLYSKLTEFTGHNGAVYSAKFSPTSDLIATGGYDKLVMVWNPAEIKPDDYEAKVEGRPQPPQKALRLTGHDGPVRCVAFSPNGQLVLSGGEDNSIRVWDVAAGKGVKTLRGHGSDVHACTFSPNGKFVLAGDDQHARVWDLSGYQEVRVLHATVFAGHEDAVLSARFSHDGSEIITGSRDRTASLWNAATGDPLRRFQEGHDFLVSSAEFFPGGQVMATGGGDNSVRVWDAVKGTQQAALAPTGRVGTLAISPDGKWIATGSAGNNVQLWATPAPNAATVEKPAAVLTGHDAVVSALAFSASGEWLATGDDSGMVRLWKRAANGGYEFNRELGGHTQSISALHFTPDSQRLITASGDRTCGQFVVASGEELKQLVLKHSKWVTSLEISPDGTQALTTCDDGAARLWRLADAALLAEVKSAGKPFNAVAISPDGSLAVLTSAADKLVTLWDLSAAAAVANQQQTTRTLLDFRNSDNEVWATIFAPDGKRVLTMGGNDSRLWDIDTKKEVVRFSPHNAVSSAALSPDGKLTATGSWDHAAKIWDSATGKSIRKIEHAHNGFINSVEFSPDGRELLTAGDDGAARLWDVATGQAVGKGFKENGARVLSATFSPDGTRILTVSADKTGRIWDRASGRKLKDLSGHKGEILCGQFSSDPEGKYVITGSQDKIAYVWDVASGKPVAKLEGHSAAILSVALSPDGTRALTGSQDNTAKLWDAKTGKEILSLPGHTQEVTSVSFSPNGQSVLTSSRDGTAIIWLASDWHGAQPKVTAAVERRP